MVLYATCFRVSFCNVFTFYLSNDISLCLGSIVATLWERAAHSVNHMLVFCPFAILVIFSISVSRAKLWV